MLIIIIFYLFYCICQVKLRRKTTGTLPLSHHGWPSKIIHFVWPPLIWVYACITVRVALTYQWKLSICLVVRCPYVHSTTNVLANWFNTAKMVLYLKLIWNCHSKYWPGSMIFRTMPHWSVWKRSSMSVSKNSDAIAGKIIGRNALCQHFLSESYVAF